jgi:hypothetical protein
MNINTRKYIRVLDAQTKIYNKLEKLTCTGANWKKERNQEEKLEAKNNDFEKKLNSLSKLISKEDFENFLEDRMCCSYEDFKN